MTVGELLFWIFIGLPIAGTLLWWVVMIVLAPFIGIGAGIQAMKDKKNK